MNSLKKTVVDRVPSTRSALLPNSWGDVTRHEFDHAQQEPILTSVGAIEAGVVFYYRCSETGALRAWGCEYTNADLRKLRARP